MSFPRNKSNPLFPKRSLAGLTKLFNAAHLPAKFADLLKKPKNAPNNDTVPVSAVPKPRIESDVLSDYNGPSVILDKSQTVYEWPQSNQGTYAYLIKGHKPITIKLGPDLQVTDVSQFFVIGSDDVTIIGSDNEIPIICPNGYAGLIQNGTDMAYGYNNITVKNIKISGISTADLQQDAGWIGGSYFGNNARKSVFIDCVNNAEVFNAAGIIGSYSTCSAYNCHNTGLLNGAYGGIFGNYAKNSYAENCSNSGNIFSYGCGGIFGGIGADNCKAKYCSNKGVVSGFSCGGIFGGAGPVTLVDNNTMINMFNGPNDCSAKYCSNSGDLYGNALGGIFGGGGVGISGLGGDNYNTDGLYTLSRGPVNCIAKKCYNIGKLDTGFEGIYSLINLIPNFPLNIQASGMGGIFGGSGAGGDGQTPDLENQYNSLPGLNGGDGPSNCQAIDCSNTGNIYSAGAGGIFGGNGAAGNGGDGVEVSDESGAVFNYNGGNGGSSGAVSLNNTAINCCNYINYKPIFLSIFSETPINTVCGIFGGFGGRDTASDGLDTQDASGGTAGALSQGPINSKAINCYSAGVLPEDTVTAEIPQHYSDTSAIFPLGSVTCLAEHCYVSSDTFNPIYVNSNVSEVEQRNCSTEPEANGVWANITANKYLKKTHGKHKIWTRPKHSNNTPYFLTSLTSLTNLD